MPISASPAFNFLARKLFRRVAASLTLAVLAFGIRTAQGQADEGESVQILLEDLNQSRLQQGLQPLAMDPSLAVAAQRHADLMLESDTLDHQLPGELGLAERCSAAGANFSLIGENIAEGGALHSIHASWMHSPAHRENILTPAFTVVGIGIARRGRRIYAVEDFSAGVASQTTEGVEQRVRDMLAIRDIDPMVDPALARAACLAGDRRYSGAGRQPGLVIQFTSPDLDKLGPIFDQKIKPEMYRSASVGACQDKEPRGFTRFKLTVLLF